MGATVSVMDVLAQEHVLLLEFVGQLQWDEPLEDQECARMRDDLLAFVGALKRHEEFEDEILVGVSLAGAAADHARLSEEWGDEHRLLKRINIEVVDAVKNAFDGSCLRLKPLVDALAAHLREHFKWEETHLWPLCRVSLSAETERRLESRALVRLGGLKAEAAACGVLLSESSGRGPDLGAQGRGPSGD
jgi:hemerythrin-like domain-containing protein